MGFSVSEVQVTPNPNAMKFLLDRPVSPQPLSFFNKDAADGYPLAEALFAVPGVSSLLMLNNFITVNKTPAGDWQEITRQVKAVLKAHTD